MGSRAHVELAVSDYDREDRLGRAWGDGVPGNEGHVPLDAVNLLVVDDKRDPLADGIDAEVVEAFGDGARRPRLIR